MHASKPWARSVLSCLILCAPAIAAAPQVSLTKLLGSPAAAGEKLGENVAVCGDLAIVGAREADAFNGAAYVFRRVGGVWVQEARLTPWTVGTFQLFGNSVAISSAPDGDVAVVGAVFGEAAPGLWPGTVFTFRYDGVSWQQEQWLVASDAKQFDFFGATVAVHQNLLVVGAPVDALATMPNASTGTIYIYEWIGNAWQERVELTGSGVFSADQFGGSVAVIDVPGNRRVVAGAYNEDHVAGVTTDNEGSAYVFREVGNAWTEEVRLIAPAPAYRDDFGWRVAISGETVVVTSVLDDAAGTDAGAAYVFHASDWSQSVQLVAADGAAGDWFGESVALSGDLLVAGAPRYAGESGAFYAFRWDGSTWLDHGKTPAPSPMAGDFFGTVGISQGRLAVGAPGDDANGVDAGAVYFGSIDNTPVQEDVVVQPADATTGAMPVTLTFSEVTSPGQTSVTSSSGGPPPPAGFQLGNNDYYEISTTASFTGPIKVQIAYDESGVGNENNLILWHHEGGDWFDVTTDLDTQANIIYGEVMSLSPFVVLERQDVDSDGDGLLDGTELDMAQGGSCPDPADADSDGDTLSDGAEVDLGLDPCSTDSDGDQLLDHVDPNPTDPTLTPGAVQEAMQNVCAYIENLDLAHFTGPNANANKGRRNSMATRCRNAANAIGDGHPAAAHALAASVFQQMDGEPEPPDWVAMSPETTPIAGALAALVALLAGL